MAADDPGLVKAASLAAHRLEARVARSSASNPTHHNTLVLGRLPLLIDDPALGFLGEQQVDAVYADGTAESLVTDDEGIVLVLVGRGQFVDLRFETELREHVKRAFLAVGDVATNEGAWKRLVNLGYVKTVQPPPEPPTPESLAGALEEFQSEHGVLVTGDLDAVTISQLGTVYDERRTWSEREGAVILDPRVDPENVTFPKDQHC